MSKLNYKVYVAIGRDIYAFERAELREWLAGRATGRATREADPDVMGEKLKSVYSVKRQAFPASLKGRLCFCVDAFEANDYLALWTEAVKGVEQFTEAVNKLNAKR
jgi:hypothetical protein